jgi:hypothetical protein
MENTFKIQGIIVALTPTEGTNDRGTWSRCGVRLSYMSGDKENQCVLESFGSTAEKIISELTEGMEAIFSFNINAKEWNGKWYNNLSIWKFEFVEANGNAAGYVPPKANPLKIPLEPFKPLANAPLFVKNEVSETGVVVEEQGDDLPF